MEYWQDFYDWWAGLSRAARLLVAGGLLTISATCAWLFPDAWLVWSPPLIVGGALVVCEL